MALVWILLLLAVVLGVVGYTSKVGQRKALQRKEVELAPVRRLVEEDITALGTELQDLDTDVAGHQLDPGAHADYQRALDAYESAKRAGDALSEPGQVKHVTEILEDGRYAMACVRARVAGQALPVRRPPCFFDPRHGLSVGDVSWAPAGGAPREVPACALDAGRVRAGAEPDVRQVMVGTQRVPYWQGGRAYQPYAAGYFGSFGPMNWMFMGMMFSGGFGGGGFGGGLDGAFDGMGEGISGGVDGIGDSIGGAFDGIGDSIGGMFDGFDF